MVANRSKDTKPELLLRRLLHAEGYRYRLHRRDLPGSPDIVFPSRRKIVEVRGCFWHGHGCAVLGQLPKSRTEYWTPKIAGNKERDAKNLRLIGELGWDVLEVWECQLRTSPDGVVQEVIKFLEG
jgi:DNA mismatch endonuclease (patch repair protein)